MQGLSDYIILLFKKNKSIDLVIAKSENGGLSAKDITKFNSKYPKISLKTTLDFSDRFLIIDKTEVYYIRNHIKDVGKKSFGITKIEYKDIVKSFINKVR